MYRRIRDLREDKDLTQTQMGKILSCSQRVYSNYERGELDIPTEILRKLARYYGVSLEYLTGVSPERKAAADLSADENALLEWYGKLDEADKGLVAAMARNLAGNRKYGK